MRGNYRGIGGRTIQEMDLQTFPKTASDGVKATFCGRLFLSRAAATEKARSPMIEKRVRRTTSDDDEVEWRR